jgi:GntR family transcriptional regulator of vanillate catabolism
VAKGRAAGKAAVVTLAQSVTDALRKAIMEGQFQPDERLQEELLAERLNVSRTPIRAALHGLTAEGLVEYVPNRGYSVRRLDAGQLIAVFDVRGALEGVAARLAAERGMDEAAQAQCRAALEEGDRIVAKGRLLSGDRNRFSEVNALLHEAVLRAADNSMLGDMLRVCYNIPISSDRNVLWRDFGWLRRSHDDHHRIFDAICRREGARAEQLMREHVHSVKLHMREQIEGTAPAVRA